MEPHSELTAERMAHNLKTVRDHMAAAAARRGRPAEGIKLVAVTKYVDAAVIRMLLEQGIDELGENRVQAARPKLDALGGEVAAAGARWRFIGHLQTNKVKYAVRDFATLDAVDSLRLLEAIDQETRKHNRPPMPCLAEVNLSAEEQKHGLNAEDLEAFLQAANGMTGCQIQGLMAMAPFAPSPEATSRPIFAALRALLLKANEKGWYRAPLTELSMGMTQDYPIAIEEGATMVRVGSALYA